MSDLKSQELAYGERIGSGGSDAVLSSYFREILLKLGIDSNRFQHRLDRYIIRRGSPINMVEISTARSALRRELMSQTMTWRVFIKGLIFLYVKNMTMTLTLFHEDNKRSLHEYKFDLADIDDSEESKERGVLAKFFAQILDDLKVDPDKFEYYLDKYVKMSKPGSSANAQYTAKSSVSREILKSNISWKVFVKGLIFLETYKMIFELEMHHQTGLISSHQKTIVFK